MSYQETAQKAIEYFKTNKLLSNPTIKNIQSYLKDNHYNSGKADGFWGPQTDSAYSTFIEKRTNGKVVAFRSDNHDSTPYITKNSVYPSYNEIQSYYGTLAEIPSKIVTVTLPYKHYLSWNPSKSITKVSCHKLIADRYLSILEKVNTTYGKNIHKLRLDLFGGSWANPARKMRGGSLISVHSYGIAFDYDPDHNQLKWGRDKAAFATPDYYDWMSIWSEEGAFNLGDLKNYDYMHFQFSKP